MFVKEEPERRKQVWLHIPPTICQRKTLSFNIWLSSDSWREWPKVKSRIFENIEEQVQTFHFLIVFLYNINVFRNSIYALIIFFKLSIVEKENCSEVYVI